MAVKAPKTKDLSKCPACGSDKFLVDTTDTLEVTLTAEGRIWEFGKRYDGDWTNLNCAKCGRPADRQPDAKEAT